MESETQLAAADSIYSDKGNGNQHTYISVVNLMMMMMVVLLLAISSLCRSPGYISVLQNHRKISYDGHRHRFTHISTPETTQKKTLMQRHFEICFYSSNWYMEQFSKFVGLHCTHTYNGESTHLYEFVIASTIDGVRFSRAATSMCTQSIHIYIHTVNELKSKYARCMTTHTAFTHSDDREWHGQSRRKQNLPSNL